MDALIGDTRKALRIGLLGCGRISARHVDAVASMGNLARIAATCDIIPQRARRAAEQAGCVPWFTDVSAMLGAGGLDAVAVCSPSGLHPQHGCLAASAGCHVLCEKPAGITLAAVDGLMETCARAGRRLFVVMQNRLNPPVAALKQAVDAGRFGRICLAEANVFWCRPQAYYDEASWRGTIALDGGAFMNQACHYVDLLQWLLGDVVQVSAMSGTLARRIEADDTGSAILRFASGAIASVNVTMVVQPSNFEGAVTVIGTQGTVRLGGVALNRVEHWEFARPQPEDEALANSGIVSEDVYGSGHRGWYACVVEALRTGMLTDFEGSQARRTVALLASICEAARTGTVQYPDVMSMGAEVKVQ